jgi:hypothetical protein
MTSDDTKEFADGTLCVITGNMSLIALAVASDSLVPESSSEATVPYFLVSDTSFGYTTVGVGLSNG